MIIDHYVKQSGRNWRRFAMKIMTVKQSKWQKYQRWSGKIWLVVINCCVKSMGCKIIYGEQTHQVISVTFLPPMMTVINGKYITTDFFWPIKFLFLPMQSPAFCLQRITILIPWMGFFKHLSVPSTTVTTYHRPTHPPIQQTTSCVVG